MQPIRYVDQNAVVLELPEADEMPAAPAAGLIPDGIPDEPGEREDEAETGLITTGGGE
jgi:hypothetical protein